MRLQSPLKEKMLLSNYIKLEKCGRKESFRIILWLIAVCVLAFILIAYSPVEMLFSYLGYQDTNGCTLYTFLGFPCPTCGMGRTLKDFVVLDFSNIFYYNPTAIFIFIFALLIILFIIVLAIFNYKLSLTNKLLKMWYIPVLILILIWVLNILYGHHEHH